MTPERRSKTIAKGVCLVLALGFWWAIKIRLEPDFWRRAVEGAQQAAQAPH
jgi:hypothetical protein